MARSWKQQQTEREPPGSESPTVRETHDDPSAYAVTDPGPVHGSEFPNGNSAYVAASAEESGESHRYRRWRRACRYDDARHVIEWRPAHGLTDLHRQ